MPRLAVQEELELGFLWETGEGEEESGYFALGARAEFAV